MNTFYGRPRVHGLYWFTGKVRGIAMTNVAYGTNLSEIEKMNPTWFKLGCPVLVNVTQGCSRVFFYPCDWIAYLSDQIYTGIVFGAEIKDMRGRWAGPVEIPWELTEKQPQNGTITDYIDRALQQTGKKL